MYRHYYVSDDLNELQNLRSELEASGISPRQIHILADRAVGGRQARHLRRARPVQKRDVPPGCRHVFFVDVKAEEEPILDIVVLHHPRLVIAGFATATPNWLLALQRGWQRLRQLI